MNSGKYQFQKLTPTTEAEIEVYEDALDFVFENPDIHNVAVSGAYGAGKSSLIESYKAKHPDKKFLHLSLSHFVPAEDSKCNSSSNPPEGEGHHSDSPMKESVLEGKILNQLLHQIPAGKLPQSNFKVKEKIKPWKIAVSSAFVMIYILGILRILLRHQLQNFTTSLEDGLFQQVMACLSQPYWIVVAASICATYTAWLIYRVIWLQKSRSIFKRINLHGNEIEIFEKQDESYFDKYLNEVLYLFENSGADVIVFEDMDRFNTSQIFERLHEINRLVNVQRIRQQMPKKQKCKMGRDKKDREQKCEEKCKPLRFFYLLRDDMFVSKDRTKFFDFIIPVVPVIDGSNSYDKFLEFFREAGYLENFDKSFLQGLALYVDDMRILKNICNEFTVYINRVNNINLNWNKMLALIAYKNIFPRDFSDLQLGKGFVYALFHKKGELIEKKLKELRASQRNLQDDIRYIDERILISPWELEVAEKAECKRYNQKYYPTKEESADHIKYQEEISKRKARIQKIQNDNRDELTKKLSEVEHQIQHVEAEFLKDLITRENIGEIFSAAYINEIGQPNNFDEIKSSNYFPLLKFLIRNGHIDETYPDYMSYFYEESISAHDKMFLRRITDRLGAEYTYQLNAPEKVVESPVIRNVEFEQEETLNFALLNYLLEHLNNGHNDEFVNILIEQLRNTERFDFIVQYYGLDRTHQQFVVKLNDQWNGFFQNALQGIGFTEKQVKQYSLDTLYYSAPEVIQAVNGDGCLCEYISTTPGYLAIEHPDTGKLMEGFELLNVAIEKLTDDGVDPVLLDGVYQRDLYVLNADNIAFLLRKKYGVLDEKEILHHNFTLVCSQKEEALYQYVMKNLPTYAVVMLSICENEICDTEAVAVNFLNLEGVDPEQKSQYITGLTTKIVELSKITDTKLWTQLLNEQKINHNAENMLHFYLKFGLTDLLIGYINQLPNGCDFSEIAERFEVADRERLFSSIVKCNAICNQQYEMVLLGLDVSFIDFDASEIETDKLSVLIQAGILHMDPQTLQFIRSKYTDHRFTFIEHNLDAYLELQSNDLADSDEIEEILSWDILDEHKLKLLSFVDRSISVVKKPYSDEITAYILENCYKEEDFRELCRNYSHYGAQTKDKILGKAIQEQYQICYYNILLDDTLLSELLCCKDVDETYKLQFFVNGIPKMNEDACKRHFEELGVHELCGIFDRYNSNRKYVKNEKATVILDGLKQNGWIYSYSVDARNPQKYVVTKKTPNHK